MTMKLRLSFTVALALVALEPAARAQPSAPNPMMAHYRAYIAADARGDYYAAEKEAEAALAAAEATQSSRIGVLATNLARVRALRQGNLGGALAPARRALDAGGVDPLQTRILIALAELPTASSNDLGSLLAQAKAAPTADLMYLYQVADAWADWLFDKNKLEDAATAYSVAIELASAMGSGAAIEESLALTGLGVANLYMDKHRASLDALTRALELAAPLAPESEGAAIPPGEIAYFSASAWLATLRNKVEGAERGELPERPRIDRPIAAGPPLCRMDWIKRQAIEDPRIEGDRVRPMVATVILRFRVSEDGSVSNVQIAAAAPPSAAFSDVTVNAFSSWSVRWIDSAPQCRRSTDDATYSFRFAIAKSARGTSSNRVKPR